MLVSAVQQSESAMCILISPPSWTFLPLPHPYPSCHPSRWSQNPELQRSSTTKASPSHRILNFPGKCMTLQRFKSKFVCLVLLCFKLCLKIPDRWKNEIVQLRQTDIQLGSHIREQVFETLFSLYDPPHQLRWQNWVTLSHMFLMLKFWIPLWVPPSKPSPAFRGVVFLRNLQWPKSLSFFQRGPPKLMGRLGWGETVAGKLATGPDQSFVSAAWQLPEVTATAQAGWLGCAS